MIRHGYTNCSGCHTDPSGGELLTLYGHAISWEALSSRYGGSEEAASAAMARRIGRAVSHAAHGKGAAPKKKAPKEEPIDLDEEEPVDEESAESEEAGDADGEGGSEESSEAPASEPSPFEGMGGLTGPMFGLVPPSESLLLGGSVRLVSTFKPDAEDDKFKFFPMQMDLYGQVRFGSVVRAGLSLGLIQVPPGSPHGRPAQVTTGQGDTYNLLSRTHWVGFDFGSSGQHSLRLGRLNLPFGIRMSEHVMWVRERTQTDRESDQQHGVALYMGFDNVRFELMGILGNYQVNPDAFRERGYSGYIEIAAAEKLAVGVSSLYTYAKDDRLEPSGLSTSRHAHGPFVRWAPAEAVAVMAEFDVLLRTRRDAGYVGFLQFDVEPAQGLHFIATGELLDAGYPDRVKVVGGPRAAGLGRPLPGGWLSLQWFFLPHFDVRVDAIIREDKQIMSQLHVYL